MANVFNEETHHMHKAPAAHKQTNCIDYPGHIVNPIGAPGIVHLNHDMMDDTAGLPPVNVRAEDGPAFRKLVTAAAYRPTHGGYPDAVQQKATPAEERAALRLIGL